MRKIILNLAVSLDGFIEGPNGEYDWCLTDQDYGMEEFTAATDAIFIGRKSYELIANEPQAMFDKKIYVFSDTLTAVEGNAEIIRSADLLPMIDEIRHRDGKDIWLFGGAQLVSALMAHNYVNELLLSVHPVILGGGKPLFKDVKERTNLTLLDTLIYSTGLVQLQYAVNPRFDMSMMSRLG